MGTYMSTLPNDYKIEKTLSIGPNGTVYKASKDGELYTLKVMNKKSPQCSEADILQKLQGINGVPEYKTHYEDSHNIVIVTKFITGIDFYNYLNKSDILPKVHVKKIFVQLCTILQRAHSRGIIHRDIKPENILIDQDNTVYIIDWGLGFEPAKTALRKSCGSPNYASPEAVRGVKYNGPELDVWSVGCVLYTALTKRMAFEDDYIRALFTKIKRCQVDWNDRHLCPKEINLMKKIFVLENRIDISGILNDEWLR